MNKRFQIGDLIGEYRVTGFLGEGGMGVVYLGVHEKLGRSAAIKILGNAAADPSFKARFFNEARLQAALHHPNIATLYDFREQGDELFIFMEYVDGECLEDLIERRAFTIDETVRVFTSICEAIAYVHRNGVLHRDIKAQNAKVRSDGSLKLLDFGIAKDGSSHGLTQTGGLIGTPNYLSPEQLEGLPASEQTDIWALGILLYEMLTGQVPFQAETMGSLVLKITLGHFPPAHEVDPRVPRELSDVVAKCLAKDTSVRYRSVDELLNDLRNVKARTDSRARVSTDEMQTVVSVSHTPSALSYSYPASQGADLPNQESEPQAKSSFPFGWVAAAGGTVFVLLIAAIGGIVLFASSGGTANNTVQPSPKTNTTAPAASKADAQIKVDVDEGKAQVFRNGSSIGTTPVSIDASMGEKLDLTLKKDGFEDKNVTIDVAGNKRVFTFSMKAK
ncbi:MAG: serine/threonine protein kinase [Acidobacteria bacterium]|nr:serine/threonine protein kinase [Acidobacteriota bacterium]